MMILIIADGLIFMAAGGIAAFAVFGYVPSARQVGKYHNYLEEDRKRAQLRHPSSRAFQGMGDSAATLVPQPRRDRR